MKKNKKKDKIYKSMREYEERFFPNSLKKRLEESKDIQTIAINLADESLEKIRNRLAK